jgi:class 3 adenylate cyclase
LICGNALDGERKTVTALFADIKGSMELMEELDPEDARAIVDPALKLMIDAVQHYDGYIVQTTGAMTGVFALTPSFPGETGWWSEATVLKVNSSELREVRCPQGPQALGTLEVSRLWTCGQRTGGRFKRFPDIARSMAYWS